MCDHSSWSWAFRRANTDPTIQIVTATCDGCGVKEERRFDVAVYGPESKVKALNSIVSSVHGKYGVTITAPG